MLVAALVTATVAQGIIVALISSAAVLVGQMLLRRQTKDKLIAEASQEVAEGATLLLQPLREELSRAREQIEILRERIAALESQLAEGKVERRQLREEREQAVGQLIQLQERVRVLEREIRTVRGS